MCAFGGNYFLCNMDKLHSQLTWVPLSDIRKDVLFSLCPQLFEIINFSSDASPPRKVFGWDISPEVSLICKQKKWVHFIITQKQHRPTSRVRLSFIRFHVCWDDVFCFAVPGPKQKGFPFSSIRRRVFRCSKQPQAT